MKKIISTLMVTLIILSSFATSQALAATAKVNLTLSNSTKGVVLKWTKVSTSKSYSVYRKLSTGKKYTLVKKINNKKTTSYTDKTAKSGKKYSYKLTTSTGAKSTKTIMRLTTPANVKVVLKSSGDISISWSKVTGAKKYSVYRAAVTSSGTGKYKHIYDTKSNKYSDWDFLTIGKSYKYKVAAINGKYTSAKSKESNKLNYIEPTEFVLGISKDYKGVQFYYYTDKNITKYEIYRKASGGSYSKIATITKPTIDKISDMGTYKDTTCKADVTYTYYIKSYAGKLSIASKKESIKYNDCDYKLKVGETKKISILSPEEEQLIKDYEDWGMTVELSYTSLNEDVATISDDCTVTAMSPGIADIKVTMTIKMSAEEINDTTLSTNANIRIKVVE